MMTATEDGDAIFARAITIAAPEEREAYLAQACGEDAALRRQIEDRLAAHFEAGSDAAEPASAAPRGDHPSRLDSGQTSAAQAHHDLPQQTSPQGKSSLLARGGTILILGLGAACICLGIWAVQSQGEARRAAQQSAEERERVKKVEEEVEQQREQAETARKALAEERDQAVEKEKAARDAAADLKAVLAFFQNKVLSAGRPVGWSGGMGKAVTLRKAVDAADAKVGEAFNDRPLGEAAIRETLGSTYIDLEEPGLAVKEYERALALREALQGEDHYDTVVCRNHLAVAYRLADRPEEASRLLNEAGTPSAPHAEALLIRGVLLLSQKKPTQAEQILRECLAIRQKLQADDWTTFEAKSLLGEALREQKKYAEAEPLLQSGYEGLRKRESRIPFQGRARVTQALARLVHLYEDWGKTDRAAPWRKMLEAAKREQP